MEQQAVAVVLTTVVTPPHPHRDRDVLCGRSLRLRHGWVGVVNRGQADINKKMNMRDARDRETDFFRVRGWVGGGGCDRGGGRTFVFWGEPQESRLLVDKRRSKQASKLVFPLHSPPTPPPPPPPTPSTPPPVQRGVPRPGQHRHHLPGQQAVQPPGQ